jgi:hypothetical protein
MKISEIHQEFADELNDQRALDYPEEFLGPNWKEVLNFWLYLDTLSLEQIDIAWRRYRNLDEGERFVAFSVADVAAHATLAGNFIDAAACEYDEIGDATRELMGVHKILELGKSLTFVPLLMDL